MAYPVWETVSFGPFLWWTVAFDAKPLVTLHLHLNLVDECTLGLCCTNMLTMLKFFSQTLKYAAVTVTVVAAAIVTAVAFLYCR